MDEKVSDQTANLELQGVIGFNGQVRNGLLLHPGDGHIIFPLGSTIVVRHLTQMTQTFLQRDGHDQSVSCLALSSSGKYLASGQTSHTGFKANIIIWNLETYEICHKLEQHVGKVQDLAFSSDEQFLASLGGRDDNKLVIWNVETGQSICGATASSETALTVKFYNNDNHMLVTGGVGNLNVWNFDLQNRKIRPNKVILGALKRKIESILIDDDDRYLFCGTSSGDVLKIQLHNNAFLFKKASKKPLCMGVNTLVKQQDGLLVAGAGDGTVCTIDPDTLKRVNTTKFSGPISSLALNANQDHFFVGTTKCNIFLVAVDSLEYELRNTCHSSHINDVCFPHKYSGVFATCGKNDVRVWNAKTRCELLRINVPNLECLCIAFSPDGSCLFSGWDDGKIRAFAPESGKLLYVIHNAHRDGVTALCCTADNNIISGGEAGRVRVWKVSPIKRTMVADMKEHKGRVNSIYINEDNSECVTASNDGSCIVWSLTRYVRNLCLFASTNFKAAIYHPDQSQLLTTGTDRKLTNWDVPHGDTIRILDGSNDNINCLDITEDGEAFVSAGADKLVKLWGYDEGKCYAQGVGHSGCVLKTRISPDGQTIVSVGDEGAIFLWTMPQLVMPED